MRFNLYIKQFCRSGFFLAVIFFLFTFQLSAQDKSQEYQKTIAMADAYFAQGDYINAKASYQLAVKLLPEDQYAKDRLQESLEMIKVQMHQNSLYAEKILVADDLYRQKDLEAALKVYQEALQFLPDDAYALGRVEEIEKTFRDARQVETDYLASITAGDEYLAKGDLSSSLAEFKKASSLKPGESYPAQKITEVEKLIGDQKLVSGSYDKCISDAELAIQRKKYDEAILHLEQAVKLKPEEAYPKQKLLEVKQLKQDYDAYSSIIEAGDNYYIEKDFENARTEYQRARVVKPEDDYPKRMLEKIEIALMDIEKSNASSFEVAIARADKLYSEQDYEQAIVEYKNALRFKPDEEHAKQRISDINNALGLRKSQEEAYAQTIAKADGLFKEQRYEEALAEYDRAIGFKSMEQYPKVKVDEIETILANMASQREVYNNLVTGADRLFFNDDYAQAREQYRRASDMFPKEQYPLDQIRMINEILGMRDTYTKTITEADRLANDRKYEEALVEYRKAATINEKEAYPEGRIYEIETLIAEQQQEIARQREYDSVLFAADDYFDAGDYPKAMESYEAALKVLPTEGYPKKKMDEINRIGAEKVAREAFDKQYTDAVAEADQLLAAKDYQGALTAFQHAHNLKPAEQYPNDKIAEINGILGDIAAKEAMDKQYAEAIINADKLFQGKDYTNALAAYQSALNLKPTEQYPSSRATEINGILGEIAAKEAMDKQFADAVSYADKLFEDKDYASALTAYKNARALKPGEAYTEAKITEINGILGELAAQEALDKQYAETIADADKFLSTKNYQDALGAYQSALNLKPAEQYPKAKIDGINVMLGEIEAKEALDQQYAEAVANADKLFVAGDYANALAAYQSALNIKPAEPYPTARVTEINVILGDIAAKEALDKQFADAIASADRLFQAKDYKNALAAYQSALNIKPSEQYPTAKVAEINGILGEIATKEALDKQYQDAIVNADRLLDAKDYAGAMTAYKNAQALMPGEAYPGKKITEINGILDGIAKEKELLNKQYAESIAVADKLLMVKDYQNALIAYQSALKLKAGEAYPTSKITEINAILGELAAQEALDKQYAEIINNADKLFISRDYQGALAAYQSAVSLKPGEQHPNNRIGEINGILQGMAAKEALDQQYAMLISEADALMASRNYAEARQKYESAAALKPGETYTRTKIVEIDGALAEVSKQQEIDKKYNDAVAFGDKHFASKDYVNARYEYQIANSIKGLEAYPKQKIAEIDVIEAGIRKQNELDSQYSKLIAAADEYFAKGSLEEARFSYQEALKLKPAEAYPQNKLRDIETELQTLALERGQAYDIAISKGDNYLAEKNYEMAKVQYDRAIEIKPNEVYPLDRLKLVNEQIMMKRQVVQEEYDKSIADADKFYASKIYDNAIDSYRAASIMKPEEEYPKEMVRRILKLLSERSIVQINKEPLLIADNTQQKFEFLPVPVKDRKSNYIFFRARNVSANDYKLIISFGKDQTKNGGVVVKVPAGADLNEFIIRISAQYKWFSDDNNWITFYPEGGDLEVSLLQISYSD